MKKVIPNIVVKDATDALDFYQETFGGEIKNFQLTDKTNAFHHEEGKLLHAELHINDDCVIFINESFDDNIVESNVNIVITLDSEDEINSIYDKLIENGQPIFELQITFWGSYHAVVKDCYNVTWSLDYAL